MPGFVALAYHTSDIQYLFPGWSGGPDGIKHSLNNRQMNLSNQLVAAWTKLCLDGQSERTTQYALAALRDGRKPGCVVHREFACPFDTYGQAI